MKDCGNSQRYNGTRKPNCNNKKPCEACKSKYKKMQAATELPKPRWPNQKKGQS